MNEEFDPLVAEWRSFVKNPNFNLTEKCLKFAQLLEYPDLDVEAYIQKISKIGMSLKESAGGVRDPKHLILMLNEHLFENLGFEGDYNYFDPKSIFLNDVIDNKFGLSITLSIMYSEIAKFVGLDIKIMGFPHYVVVKYGEDILDPSSDGRLLDADDLQKILNADLVDLEFQPEFLIELSSEQILLRIARSLKDSYQSFEVKKALQCADMVLATGPVLPDDIRDKGILEARMLNYDTALRYLGQYLMMHPNAEDVDYILAMIKNIRDTSR